MTLMKKAMIYILYDIPPFLILSKKKEERLQRLVHEFPFRKTKPPLQPRIHDVKQQQKKRTILYAIAFSFLPC
jgi:hypothetical protein